MAHIVFLTYGGASYLNAYYRLAHQLHQRGHQISFMSSVDVRDAVNAQGFDFILLSEESAIRHDRERQRLENLPAYRRYFNRAALIRLGEKQKAYFLQSCEFDNIMRQIEPDLLLMEEELSEYAVAVEKFSFPKILLQHWPGTRKTASLPPLTSTIIPRASLWSKIKIELAWWLFHTKEKLKRTVAPFYYKGTNRHSILKAFSASQNFPFEDKIDLGHFLPVFNHLPTMFFFAWEYDFPHQVAEPDYYVGPAIFLERQESFVDPHYQRVRQEILERKQSVGNHSRPVVYCAMGSMISDYDYFRRVVDVFTEKPEYDLVMAVGRQIPIERFEPIPPNVFLFTYVPQLDVLKFADLMLTHGGMGTVNECIFFGVPMLVYSAGILDQNGNAARVAYHGLGLRGSLRKDSKEEIGKKIDQILNEPQYKANVRRMQQIFVAYHNSDKAVQIIESVL